MERGLIGDRRRRHITGNREDYLPLHNRYVSALCTRSSLPIAGSFCLESKHRQAYRGGKERCDSKQNVENRCFCLDSKQNSDSFLRQVKRLDSKQVAFSPARRRANCAKRKGVMLMKS